MTKHIGDNNFKSEVLEQKGIVVVDFFATWCGPCKMIAPIIEELEGEMKDITNIKYKVYQH